jgi:hypothetical protein
MRSRSVYLYLILAVVTAIVYWQVHSHDFVAADDTEYITNNPIVQKGITTEGIVWAFTTGHTGYAHPLTWLSIMLDCQLFGLNAGVHHLVSLFIHIANSLLLLMLLRKMTAKLWPSFFVAAVFALHPAHIESVAWAAERKDVLSTLFLFLTLLAYTAYTQRQTKLRYVIVLLSYAMGLLAKPMLVTLPLILLLMDYWPLERYRAAISSRKERRNKKTTKSGKSLGYLIMEKLPLLALSACTSAITYHIQNITGTVVRPEVLSFGVRFSNAMISYAKYIIKFFWPSELAFLYPYPALPLPPWQIAASILLLLSVSVLVFKLRRLKYLTVGWLWFLITLVPVIGFVQVGVQALADRYTYVAYVGLSIMIAWGINDLLANRKHAAAILVPAMAAAIAAMAVSTYFQLGYWKNTASLYSRAAQVTHNHRLALMVRNNQAWILATSPDPNLRNPAEAIRIAKEVCSETHYGDASFLDTLGAAYAAAGLFDKAVETAKTAANLAESANQPQIKSIIHYHLTFYIQKKPYMELSLKPVSDSNVTK